MKNEAESQAVFAVSYVRNVMGRVMLPDSTVHTKALISLISYRMTHEVYTKMYRLRRDKNKYKTIIVQVCWLVG